MTKITGTCPLIYQNNLPENAQNTILETHEIKNFRGGMPPNPTRDLTPLALAVSPLVSSPWRCH